MKPKTIELENDEDLAKFLGIDSGEFSADFAEFIEKALLSSKAQNDLPDSAFAYIEPGGTKDADGKTTPRNKRHFPVQDKAHAQNALARASQSPFGDKAMPKIKAAAKKFGIDVSDDKAAVPFLIKFVDDVLAKAAGDTTTFTHDPAQIAAVRDGIIAFFIAELNEFKSGEDERWDIGVLTDVLNGWLSWWQHEYFGGETSSPFDSGDDDMTNALVTFGANADLLKRASEPDATDEVKNEAKADIAKALGLDTIIASQEEVANALKAASETIAELQKSVDTISEFALPADDVVVRPTSDQRRKSVQHDIVKGEIKQLRDRADATTEPTLKASLYVKADELEASIK
jgi:hypothetical protein